MADYGILALDLLGYGSTDKPELAAAYKGKKMASEIIEILDHEKIGKVHGVGHDWGSYLLSRLANYQPNRFYSYSFLDVAYIPPGIKFDVEAANAESKAGVGYERLGFWKFLIEDDAVTILRELVLDSASMTVAETKIFFTVRLLPAGGRQDRAFGIVRDNNCKINWQLTLQTSSDNV
jgi:soluble epoxide hydrolase/lipid-phosphate phosphatase